MLEGVVTGVAASLADACTGLSGNTGRVDRTKHCLRVYTRDLHISTPIYSFFSFNISFLSKGQIM